MSHFVAVPAAYLVQELLPKSWTVGNEATITKTIGTVMRVLIALSVYAIGAWLGGFLRSRGENGELGGKKDRAASRDEDDVSTNVDSSDPSSSSDTDDDELTSRRRSSPKSRLVCLPTKTGCVIDSATFLQLRPTKGRSPPGHLHAAVFEEKPEPAKAKKTSNSDRRWESLRTDDWETLRGSKAHAHGAERVADNVMPPGLMDSGDEASPCKQATTVAQGVAPWRKSSNGSPTSLTGSLSSPLSSGGLRPSWSVEKVSSSGLSSSLLGTTSLRPQRKL